MFAPASEWKEDIKWIAHHTHSDVKKSAAQLVCNCFNKPALRKSKQLWSQDRMFLTWYKTSVPFLFLVDRPTNIAWYKGAALGTSATGYKIQSLGR